MLAPPPLPGEVRQSRGFDLIRIQLPHPPGKIQIQIPSSYTGHTRGVTRDLTRDAGVLNWRYGAIHGARECQRAPIFFPAPQ